MTNEKTKKEVKPKPVAKPKEKTEATTPVEVVTEIVAHEAAPIIVPSDFKSKLTKQQTELIKNTIAKGASDDELKMFLYVCQRTGLDPFTKQIHLVPRWDGKLGREVRTPITGIDGYRSIAERTGAYAGNDDPIFDDEAKPTKATVTIYKIVQGVRSPFTATARWDQYVATYKPKGESKAVPTPLWQKMPHLMLGKCAEALALRKAFPAVMSGLYVAEEMHQATGPTALGKPEARPYDTAKGMIEKQTDEEVLKEYKKKILGSDKYNETEKLELQVLIDGQIGKLQKELVNKKDASGSVPQSHTTEDVGEQPE